MAYTQRTKKYTDYGYLETNPASEDAVRTQMDGVVDEIFEIFESEAAEKSELNNKLSRDGSLPMTGAMKFSKGVSGIRSYKDVLHYTPSAQLTGTLKITMPKTWTSTEITGKLKAFQYDNNKSWELNFAGYNSSSGSWFYTTAKVDGDCPFSKVRFAHDGTKCVLLIGELTTVWNYPIFAITDLLTGSSDVDGWETSWSASIITSETGITNITEANLVGTVPTETQITTGFASGWSGYIIGNKNSESLKTIHINLTKSTDITVGFTSLYGALPSELRPLRNEKRPISALDGSGNLISTGYIRIITDGSVGVYFTGTLTNARNVDLSIAYY